MWAIHKRTAPSTLCKLRLVIELFLHVLQVIDIIPCTVATKVGATVIMIPNVCSFNESIFMRLFIYIYE
jgi:hypothetical protein